MTELSPDLAPAPAGGNPVLSVRDLSIRFASESCAVSAVDKLAFDIRSGEVLALVGESGCGKSVTALALTGLLPRTARVTGSVELDGVDLIAADEAVRRQARGAEIA